MGKGGCLCQWELKAPTDRSQSDCVHEQVAKADYECPLYHHRKTNVRCMKKNACILKKPVICFFTDLSLVVEIRCICLHRRQVHSGESSHMRSAEGVAVK